ncbi:beta-parvin [Eurytemora carolleeae]|uniref:beta-parvin n=1 Tax=Eurytemora carolleeae TaxID=1294199 RepID=UPI000C784AB2|nr:beta-parvin [Eurytemora carolleeae]|eukprot:XP_023345848.1 beta-parvin-like [Eurytemora affinis]
MSLARSRTPIRGAPSPAPSRRARESPAPEGGREEESSFWEKIGTLGRKKKVVEAKEVESEGKYAIDSPGMPKSSEVPPEEYLLEENEERSMIEPRSYENPKLKELIKIIIEWINDELVEDRIIIQDIEEDLYDGQILQKLLEKLTQQLLSVPEVTQSEEGQKNKLRIVLGVANRVLGLQKGQARWSVESVHTKNIIYSLLLKTRFLLRAPIRLPENVVVDVVIVTKKEGVLTHRVIAEELTSHYKDIGMRCERDAFDTLFDHAPDKLQVVKKSLITFVNKHLNKINLEVTDLDSQFSDGVYLCLLAGLLEGYFVPLYDFHLTPQSFDEKVANVTLAFELMMDGGLPQPKARPEDIVNLDLKSTLRVLYNLFTKYKHLS